MAQTMACTTLMTRVLPLPLLLKFTLLVLSLSPVAAYHIHSVHAWAPVAVSRISIGAPRMAMDDAELSAALVKRIAGIRPEGETRPLGPDDVSALSMGPRDVVQVIFDAFKGSAEAGCYEGCRVLMSFSQLFDNDRPVDSLGRLRPGAFETASACGDYLSSEPRYRALALLAEWKTSGAPETSDRGFSAAQKLLVRRDGYNWEQMYCNMELRGEGMDRRWLVMSIYKHDFDPERIASGG